MPRQKLQSNQQSNTRTNAQKGLSLSIAVKTNKHQATIAKSMQPCVIGNIATGHSNCYKMHRNIPNTLKAKCMVTNGHSECHTKHYTERHMNCRHKSQTPKAIFGKIDEVAGFYPGPISWALDFVGGPKLVEAECVIQIGILCSLLSIIVFNNFHTCHSVLKTSTFP